MAEKKKEEAVEEEAESVDSEDTGEQTEETASSTDASRKNDKTEENRIPLSRLNAVIKERDDARKEAMRLKQERETAEHKRLAEQNDFKSLYDQIKPKAEQATQLEETVQGYQAILQEVLESTLADLQPDARALIPEDLPVDKQLKWIAKNRSVLAKPKAFDATGGKTGKQTGKKPVQAAPEQIEMARQWGMSIEEYIKFANNPADQQAEEG